MMQIKYPAIACSRSAWQFFSDCHFNLAEVEICGSIKCQLLWLACRYKSY